MGRKRFIDVNYGEKKINFRWENLGLLNKIVWKKEMIKKIVVSVVGRLYCFYLFRIYDGF